MKTSTILFKLLFIPLVIGFIAVDESKAQFKAGDFGLGVIIGEPTGLSAKYFTGQSNAFDFGLAWTLGENGNFHAHADYLFHKFDLFDVDSGIMPLYFGIGGRVKAGNNAKLGVRIPVGVSYHFPNDPIEIFFELVPVLDLAPSTSFSGNGGMGIRYYIKR